jgi:hypothetical protein
MIPAYACRENWECIWPPSMTSTAGRCRPAPQLARPVQAGAGVNHRDELYQIGTIVDLTVCAGRTDLPGDSAAGGVSEAPSGDANA